MLGTVCAFQLKKNRVRGGGSILLVVRANSRGIEIESMSKVFEVKTT